MGCGCGARAEQLARWLGYRTHNGYWVRTPVAIHEQAVRTMHLRATLLLLLARILFPRKG